MFTITRDWYNTVFLKTPYWAVLREAALNRDDHRCRFCGSPEHLHVHHLSYSYLEEVVNDLHIDLGNFVPSPKRVEEEIGVLLTLCENCHNKYHKALNRIPKMIEEPTKEYNEKLIDILTEVFDEACGHIPWANFSPANVASYMKKELQEQAKKKILKGTNVTSKVVPTVSNRHTERFQLSRRHWKPHTLTDKSSDNGKEETV